MIGRLYYDNDKNKSLEDKIKDCIALYKNANGKFAMSPEIVEINHLLYSEDIIISGIKIRPSKLVMKNCFFVGWDE